MIDLARTGNPVAIRLLEHHPKVGRIERISSDAIEFEMGAWKRKVSFGKASEELFGLIEMTDNNPLVCADSMSIPTPVGILASVALGPLIDAGLVVDAPAIMSNVRERDEAVGEALNRLGWQGETILDVTEHPLNGVVAVNVIVPILTPDRLEDIDDLYEERFGRSFFIRREEEKDWDISLAKNSQNALYRLRITTDGPKSLLMIQTMADKDGKCGAGALIHAMNVMAGFEESLGLT